MNESFYNYNVSNVSRKIFGRVNAKSIQLRRQWDVWDYSLFMLLIFALIGNTLTILVMRRNRMKKTNANLFLRCMALADISVLTLKFLIFLQKLYRIPVYQFCIFAIVIADISVFMGHWLIIVTTIERCIAVRYPLDVSQIVTKKRCWIVIVIVIAFFTMLSSTQILCLEARFDEPHYCKIKGVLDESNLRFYYLRTVYPYIKFAFMSWLPSLLSIILNLLIIVSLTSANKNTDTITEASSEARRNAVVLNKSDLNPVLENNWRNKRLEMQIAQERQITFMLVAISFSFVVLTLPFSIYELLRKLYPHEQKFKNRTVQRVVLFLFDCLHATNFILYCLTGKKFRIELKNFFKSLIKRK